MPVNATERSRLSRIDEAGDRWAAMVGLELCIAVLSNEILFKTSKGITAEDTRTPLAA